MTGAETLLGYLDRHFLEMDALAHRAGVSPAFVNALIAARAIPGAIYSVWPNGAFWSAVGGLHDGPPAGASRDWFSPAAIWWIRRAAVLGSTPADTETKFREGFLAAFAAQLPHAPDARLGYPDLFAGGTPDPVRIEAAALAEWNDWIEGGYGVCLRHWDVPSLLAKTIGRARILALTGEGRRLDLPPAEKLALLDAMEGLEAVMLPFAPHQRPHGTPGLWIDAMLVRYGLGGGEEGAVRDALPRLCA